MAGEQTGTSLPAHQLLRIRTDTALVSSCQSWLAMTSTNGIPVLARVTKLAVPWQVGLRGVGFMFKDQMAQYDEEIVSGPTAAAGVAFYTNL